MTKEEKEIKLFHLLGTIVIVNGETVIITDVEFNEDITKVKVKVI